MPKEYKIFFVSYLYFGSAQPPGWLGLPRLLPSWQQTTILKLIFTQIASQANSEIENTILQTQTPHMSGKFFFGVTAQFHMNEFGEHFGLTSPDKDNTISTYYKCPSDCWKVTQPVIICKLEFVIETADGAARSSEIVSYSAQGVFFQSVYWLDGQR